MYKNQHLELYNSYNGCPTYLEDKKCCYNCTCVDEDESLDGEIFLYCGRGFKPNISDEDVCENFDKDERIVKTR